MVGTGFITKGAIFGLNGAQWCTSPGYIPFCDPSLLLTSRFQLSGPEATALIAGFNDAGPLRANGLWLQGAKYLVLRADERSIYGKKGAGGVVAVKTGQAVLIGIYDENIQPGQAYFAPPPSPLLLSFPCLANRDFRCLFQFFPTFTCFSRSVELSPNLSFSSLLFSILFLCFITSASFFLF